MPIYTFLTSSYAQGIYLYGNRRFTDRDGKTGIPVAYHVPVMQYAADNYYNEQISNALTQTWLLQSEYDSTMALKGPEDPQSDSFHTTAME